MSIRYKAASLNSAGFAEMHDLQGSGGSGDDYADNGNSIDRFKACLAIVD